jgi:hypothetical protein
VVDVDKNKQTLNFSGWVRSRRHLVAEHRASERVADAALTYQLSGNPAKTRAGSSVVCSTCSGHDAPRRWRSVSRACSRLATSCAGRAPHSARKT